MSPYTGISRRHLLRGLLAGAMTTAGCGSSMGHGRGRRPQVSSDVARRMLDLVEGVGEQSAVLNHAGLSALVRHQHLSGNVSAASGDVLRRALANILDVAAARNVLATWRGREAELYEAAQQSAWLLPRGYGFGGVIYLVAGYDIGVAAPPDIALNVAHPHFCARPTELGFYATHEAHHVGFLGLRRMPAVQEAIQSRAGLRHLVRFMTQMEGMAVHAALRTRRAAMALGDDEDYQVYLDRDAAEQVRRDYARHWASAAGDEPPEDSFVGELLNAMSSGDRLFYRFGALVCQTLEERAGTRALVSSITSPDRFWQVARYLMG